MPLKCRVSMQSSQILINLFNVTLIRDNFGVKVECSHSNISSKNINNKTTYSTTDDVENETLYT